MQLHDTQDLSTTGQTMLPLAGQKRKLSDVDAERSLDRSTMRRRITRACDQCNQLRTKCDGNQPCCHCADNKLSCDYARIHKKRGRVAKKELARDINVKRSDQSLMNAEHRAGHLEQPSLRHIHGADEKMDRTQQASDHGASQEEIGSGSRFLRGFNTTAENTIQNPAELMDTNALLTNQTFNYTSQDSNNYMSGMQLMPGFGFPLGDDYSVAFMGKAPLVESPDWMTMASVMQPTEQLRGPLSTPEGLRYPVLLPLASYLEPIMPQALACDLLEQYFTSSTNTYLQPKNPYIIGSIFRKTSILHQSDPRPCSPALLASMLWISAQHSDAVFLTSHPDARSRTCQQLLELTITMLKPLVHNSSSIDMTGNSTQTNNTRIDSALAGLVSPIESVSNSIASRSQLDNIATYMHLATVVSASERKAASLRWWNAAWSLAREIRLGRELPDENADGRSSTRDPAFQTSGEQASLDSSNLSSQVSGHSPVLTEEYREERRRVWWLLYMTDRHLALCYNRPLSFLNQECESLLLPIDDDIWQSEQYTTYTRTDYRRGLDIQCTSHSVFGYFLPLMVLLGEILELNYARNRPRLGKRGYPSRAWDERVNEIVQYLKEFEESIAHFERTEPEKLVACHSRNGTSPGDTTPGQTNNAVQARLQTDTVVAYSRHIMHVLHILLTGKWDPIAMLDDNDLWISSQSFVTATGHAVSAANDLSDVIEYDPDLSLIPYFFGIYLLQGSFLLLLFADKLQDDITPDVVKACETVVRAHEACVATLDTQYQRNFRKVMRSALQQLRGRRREDPVQQQNWRRGILKLYRWTSDGTGLAL